MICEECGKNVDRLHPARLGRSPHSPKIYLCQECYGEKFTIREQASRHVARARKLGLPATLTYQQWKKTILRFERKCAYCGYKGEFYLDHFIPLSLGGGTTANNCIPACSECNRRKWNFHPDLITWVLNEDMERIRIYLQAQTNF